MASEARKEEYNPYLSHSELNQSSGQIPRQENNEVVGLGNYNRQFNEQELLQAFNQETTKKILELYTQPKPT